MLSRGKVGAEARTLDVLLRFESICPISRLAVTVCDSNDLDSLGRYPINDHVRIFGEQVAPRAVMVIGPRVRHLLDVVVRSLESCLETLCGRNAALMIVAERVQSLGTCVGMARSAA